MFSVFFLHMCGTKAHELPTRRYDIPPKYDPTDLQELLDKLVGQKEVRDVSCNTAKCCLKVTVTHRNDWLVIQPMITQIQTAALAA